MRGGQVSHQVHPSRQWPPALLDSPTLGHRTLDLADGFAWQDW